MKTYIRQSAALLLIFASITTFGLFLESCSKQSDKKEVVAMLPLTGDLAFLGEPGRIALQIAKADLQKSGGPLSFVIDDTKASSEETVTLMRKEKDVNGRNIFI